MMAALFDPIQIGQLTLPNRIFMAPMTRSRANAGAVVEDIVATYYTQRASAGLIISEGVFPSASGKGYVRTPGMVGTEHVAGWKRVTDAVHAQGGHIFMQVMHCGRISHPDMQPGNALPIAPSAIKPDGEVWTDSGLQQFVSPRQATEDEIGEIIEAYGRSAALALEAGFDGVELHGAAGYLPEQFLSTGTNQRDDRYGGSITNRSRFMLEVLESMVAAAGRDRVGLKISPEMHFNSITDANPVETYTYLVDRLEPLGLAYLHVALFGEPSTDYHALLRPRFGGIYLAGGGLTKEAASAMLAEGRTDAAVFGTAFIANPDLPERFRQNADLADPDRSTFYSAGAEGFTDYPSLQTGQRIVPD